jgi:pimeloyl-ACP methyl ester carboxylesterase
MPPPPPSIAGKAGCFSFLSFAAARDRCFSHRFLAAGLRPLAVHLPDAADPVTTVHMWVPASPPRNPLVLLHGFGASATWQWYPYLRPLIAAGFDPIVPDLVFFGNSCTRLPDRSDMFQVGLANPSEPDPPFAAPLTPLYVCICLPGRRGRSRQRWMPSG